MILVIFASFLVKWPCMPVDPSSIAGSMYYVYDSPMINDFNGLSEERKNERDEKVTEMHSLYKFGAMNDNLDRFIVDVDVSSQNDEA